MEQCMKRIRLAAVAASLLPIALGAQAASPAPASPITQSFVDFGGHYGGLLAAAFDSIPASRYGFKPSPAQQSIGYIAQHLEHANYTLCERIGGVTHPTTAKDSLADTVKAAWPKDTLVSRLRASLFFCRDAFARIDDTRLTDPVVAGAPGSGQMAPRARMMLYFVTDLAEHYSQLASYMRVMGMVPPSALPRPKR
jgi:uncharacterized damage-inducible protein DinB